MNLHAIVAPIVAAINPSLPVMVRVSTSSTTVNPDGTRSPAYETPGALTASIAGTVLTVSAITTGFLSPGQLLADITTVLLPGTVIIAQLTGAPGGVGTYTVNLSQTVAFEAMTTSLVLQGQVQALTFRDLTQISGLNLNGTRRGIYLSGNVDGVVRSEMKGGDLIIFLDGRVWLVAMQLEAWGASGTSDVWSKVAVTLQN